MIINAAFQGCFESQEGLTPGLALAGTQPGALRFSHGHIILVFIIVYNYFKFGI
jgi:hypothetical protein